MFSREIENDYGTYSKTNSTKVKLTGTFDTNFIELELEPVSDALYKVFECPNQSINFGIKFDKNTWIPKHMFDNLKKAYDEGNPYYKPSDIAIIQMNISGTIDYVRNKYNAKIETNTTTFSGSAVQNTGSADTGSIFVRVKSNSTTQQDTRLGIAGVQDVQFQFYENNQSNVINEQKVIEQILFLFEENNTRTAGINTITPYQNADGSVITQNLPASTDVVKPVSMRVTNLDDYLRDVKRS